MPEDKAAGGCGSRGQLLGARRGPRGGGGRARNDKHSFRPRRASRPRRLLAVRSEAGFRSLFSTRLICEIASHHVVGKMKKKKKKKMCVEFLTWCLLELSFQAVSVLSLPTALQQSALIPGGSPTRAEVGLVASSGLHRGHPWGQPGARLAPAASNKSSLAGGGGRMLGNRHLAGQEAGCLAAAAVGRCSCLGVR